MDCNRTVEAPLLHSGSRSELRPPVSRGWKCINSVFGSDRRARIRDLGVVSIRPRRMNPAHVCCRLGGRGWQCLFFENRTAACYCQCYWCLEFSVLRICRQRSYWSRFAGDGSSSPRIQKLNQSKCLAIELWRLSALLKTWSSSG